VNQVSTWKENSRHVMLKRSRVPGEVGPKFDVAVPYCRRLASSQSGGRKEKGGAHHERSKEKRAGRTRIPAGP